MAFGFYSGKITRITKNSESKKIKTIFEKDSEIIGLKENEEQKEKEQSFEDDEERNNFIEEELDKDEYITPNDFYYNNKTAKEDSKITADDSGTTLFQTNLNAEIIKDEKPKWFWIESLKNWCSFLYTDKYTIELGLWNGKSEFVPFRQLCKDAGICSYLSDSFIPFYKEGENNINNRTYKEANDYFTSNYLYNLNNIYFGPYNAYMYITEKKYYYVIRGSGITHGGGLHGAIGNGKVEKYALNDTGKPSNISNLIHYLADEEKINIDDSNSSLYLFSSLILPHDSKFSNNEESTFQNVRISRTQFFTRDQTKNNINFIVSTGNPMIFRTNDGNLGIYYYFYVPGHLNKYEIIKKDNLNFLNETCEKFFGSGNDKTIKDDWKRFNKRIDESEEFPSDIFSFKEETLYDADKINSSIANVSNVFKMELKTNKINIKTDKNKGQSFVDRWDK